MLPDTSDWPTGQLTTWQRTNTCILQTSSRSYTQTYQRTNTHTTRFKQITARSSTSKQSRLEGGNVYVPLNEMHCWLKHPDNHTEFKRVRVEKETHKLSQDFLSGGSFVSCTRPPFSTISDIQTKWLSFAPQTSTITYSNSDSRLQIGRADDKNASFKTETLRYCQRSEGGWHPVIWHKGLPLNICLPLRRFPRRKTRIKYFPLLLSM